MSPRAIAFLVVLVLGVAFLAWDEWRREQPDRGLAPFFERIALKYRQLRRRPVNLNNRRTK